jgi:dTDP-4-dehydrorhamnose 3,5-epimerase-like enzyme
MDARVVGLKILGVDEGKPLVVLEAERDIPMAFRRVYWLFGTKRGQTRGRHAHRNVKQVLICVHGSCKVLMDDSNEKQSIVLDRPDLCLYLGPMIWHEITELTDDCVLLVLTPDYYDESDYLKDYKSFRTMAD